jgi:hypothetical protein
MSETQAKRDVPETKPAPQAGGQGAGAGAQALAGEAPDYRLQIVLWLDVDDAQRTKALAKGMIKDDLRRLVLHLSQGAVKLLDPSRLAVSEAGMVRIFDHIERRFRNDPDEVEIYLSEYGEATQIMSKLADFIIDNNKTVFDEDCVRYLYRLQDEALAKVREEIEKRKEEMRRYREIEKQKSEAREILKEEIEKYEKTIERLESEIKNLKGRIDELTEVVEDYAEFVKDRDLEDEFVRYVMDKIADKESEIREKYMLN